MKIPNYDEMLDRITDIVKLGLKQRCFYITVKQNYNINLYQ